MPEFFHIILKSLTKMNGILNKHHFLIPSASFMYY